VIRDEHNRFQSHYDHHGLIEAVRKVAKFVNPNSPTATTEAAFDAARSPAGHPQCPRADSIGRRLSYPWRELLELVFDETRDAEHAIAARRARQQRLKLSDAEIASALSLVARHLQARSLRPGEYDAGRAHLIRSDDQAWLHGRRLEASLPTADQLLHALEQRDLDWDEGLKRAGLESRTGAVGAAAGLPPATAIELFIDDMGALPNCRQPRRYARHKGFALRSRFGMPQALDEVRESRRARGLETPPPCPRGELDLSHVEPLPVDATAPKQVRSEWEDEACLQGLEKAITKMKGRPLTQRALRALARTDPEIPQPSVVDRVAKRRGKTGLVDMRAEAAARLAARRSP
jgi:hypothetical protein